MREEMERGKRKPLSDITHIYNLTPHSVLRELVASNETSKPPISNFKPNSSSTSKKLCPEPSERSNTSIGSSSVGPTINPKTVQFRHPQLPGCSITSPDAAYNRRQNIEKSKIERDGNVVVSRTLLEKKKDKGKSIAVSFSSSASERMKDTRNKTCEVALTDGGIAIQKAVKFSNTKEKHSYLEPETTENSRNERESDLIGCHASIVKRKDKGKAVAAPYSSSPTGKLKDTRNNVCNSSILVGGPCQNTIGNIGVSSSSVDNVKETNKDMLFHSHASGKAERGKATLNSSDGVALGKKSEKGKDIADTSCCLLEKINDKIKKTGILKRTRSSIVQIKEMGDEYLNPFTSSVGGSKDRAKYVNTSNSLPNKTKGQGKVILEHPYIGVSSAVMEVKSRPLRKNNEKNRNAAGVSSCPPLARSKKLQNDLDDAGDVKYSDSWTDPHANGKKKRCWRTEKINEWPEDFIREQKAYYEDVDNFELPIEEVSQDELD